MKFDGKVSRLKVPFNQELDPSTWPYEIEIDAKPDRDGVVAMQANPRYGFKLFVQDGKPGLAVLCKSWISLNTTIDGNQNVLGKWTRLKASIDYNRIVFSVDGKVVESRAFPQPFKGKTNSPLLIGSVGKHPVSEAVPHRPFQGEIRSIKITRNLSDKMALPSSQPINLFSQIEE